MIVCRRFGGLVLIRQIDHAELSGVFARHWGNDRFDPPSPHESVCLGAARHDDGWLEPDERPLFDGRTRRPLHFPDVDPRQHSRFYRTGVERVIAMDPYAGLLVSMHATGLYRRWRGARLTDELRPIVEAFIAEQEALQARLARRIPGRGQQRSEFERNLAYHYGLLQVWDRLSLFACMTDLDAPAEGRLFPVPPSPGGGEVAITIRTRGNRAAALDPYPFDEPRLDLSVAYRLIPDREYAGEEDVRTALRDAREDRIECTFAPAGDG